MTLLYRSDANEPPQTGSGTFWTMRRDSSQPLAEVEAGTPNIPTTRLYEVDITFGDDLAEEPIDDLLGHLANRPRGEALPGLREALLARANRTGQAWTQFTDHGRSWKGALVYLGDEPLPARRAAAAD